MCYQVRWVSCWPLEGKSTSDPKEGTSFPRGKTIAGTRQNSMPFRALRSWPSGVLEGYPTSLDHLSSTPRECTARSWLSQYVVEIYQWRPYCSSEMLK